MNTFSFLSMSTGILIVMLILPLSAEAHVVVRPAEVRTAAFQTFTVGVPVEKEVPTVGLRLVLPSSLQHVTPNVKPGWTITVKRDGTVEDARVSEIVWAGGMIPPGQRDELLFSAQAPVEPGTVQWKAYQSYQDGSVVSWDRAQSTEEDLENTGPYSETRVIGTTDTPSAETAAKNERSKLPLLLSGAALLLAVVALFKR